MNLRCLAVMLCGLQLPLLIGGCAANRERGTSARFGPVRENVLPFSVPCVMHCFQFRTGAVFVIGHGPATTDKEFARDSGRAEAAGGVDLWAHGGKTGISQIVGEGCLFTRDLPGLSWEKTTPAEVLERMKSARFVVKPKARGPNSPFAAATAGAVGLLEPDDKDLPMTCLFKTARGAVGIMEILGVAEDKQGVSVMGAAMKFRYKLVQP
jgi:hypothetical protein